MFHTRSDAPLAGRLLQEAAALPPARLSTLTVEGQRYFVKTPETHHTWLRRLMKGDPKAAFRRELELLCGFRARGAPVARVLAADDRHAVLADHGTPLSHLLHKAKADDALLRAVGGALAGLHARDLAHGRPSLRDICWDGRRITFLDLEAGARLQARARDKARDLFVLLHSACTTSNGATTASALLLEGYRASAGSAPVLQAAKRHARRLWWADLLARPGVWLHDRRGKQTSEFRAVAPTRALILAA
ncbi:MAG: lipopolysaccharide kinase InaA family protein [Roseinatronobacter sp.]